MYMNLVFTSIDMTRLPEAVAGIEGVKRRLSAAQGFKGAYWFQPIDGQGMAMSLWEDEATAKAATISIGESPAPGVTIDRIETRAVITQV